MKRHLTLVAFHHMTCGCKLDKDRHYLMVCSLHLHAHTMQQLIRRLLRLPLPMAIRSQLLTTLALAEGTS